LREANNKEWDFEMGHFLEREKYYITALLILLALYPIFFRLDFSMSTYELFDVICMVPIYSWFYLLAICLFLSLYVLTKKTIGLIHVLAIIFLIWGLYGVSQFPSIMNGDIFVHEAFTKRLIFHGRTQALTWYPKWWPGSFLLKAILTEIAGLDVVDENMLLTYVNLVTLAAILYVLAKFIVGKKWAGLATTFYFVVNAYAFHLIGREHFVAQSLSFTIYLFTLYLLQKMQRNQKTKNNYNILVFVTICSIIISHGFTSYMLLSTLAGIMVVQRIRKVSLGVNLKLLLASLTLWFSWWIFNSFSTLEMAVNYLLSSLEFLSGSQLVKLSGALAVEPLPLLGEILRNYYFKPMLLIVGLTSLIVLFKERNSRKASFYSGILIGTALASIIALISSTEAIEIQLCEILMFLLLPSSYLASRFLIGYSRYIKILSCFILCLVPLSLATMFTYDCEYIACTHRWEILCVEFLEDHVPKDLTMATDSYTSHLYAFFDLNYTPGGILLSKGSLNYTYILLDSPTFYEGDVIVRSFRQEVVYNNYLERFEERRDFWSKVDTNLLLVNNKIYDNEFAQVYVDSS